MLQSFSVLKPLNCAEVTQMRCDPVCSLFVTTPEPPNTAGVFDGDCGVVECEYLVAPMHLNVFLLLGDRTEAAAAGCSLSQLSPYQRLQV